MDNKVVHSADVLWVCDALYSGNVQVKPHAHITYYHMAYVKKGTCQMSVNDRSYDISPGMLMLAIPEDVHSRQHSEELQLWEVKFIVHSRALSAALKEHERVFALDELQTALLEEIIRGGYNSCEGIDINANRAYLSALLHNICSSFFITKGPDYEDFICKRMCSP